MSKSCTRVKVIRYMKQNLEYHKEPETDAINTTGLAEDACEHFDAWIEDEIPEVFFDWALEATDEVPS